MNMLEDYFIIKKNKNGIYLEPRMDRIISNILGTSYKKKNQYKSKGDTK